MLLRLVWLLVVVELILGRSDSVKVKPDILAKELAREEQGDDTDDGEDYVETVVRTEKRKVLYSHSCLTLGSR